MMDHRSYTRYPHPSCLGMELELSAAEFRIRGQRTSPFFCCCGLRDSSKRGGEKGRGRGKGRGWGKEGGGEG